MIKEAMTLALEMIRNKMYAHAEMCLTEALAKQEQGEPVAWMCKENHDVIVSVKDWDNIDPLWCWMYQPLYTTPQPAQKTWVDLTDEEILEAPENLIACIAYVRNKLKEKNGIAPQPAQKPLTDAQLDDIYYCVEGGANDLETWREQARAIEARHGIEEKNT